MTTAREIADWHRAEAQRLRANDSKRRKARRLFAEFEAIKLHERFAAWLEKV